ncbi:hypothetical protein BH09VER1_BH09VER1_19700 [soil metagenome]
MKVIVLACSFLLALALSSFAGTFSVTVTVAFKGAEEETYALKEIKSTEVLLPVALADLNQYILRADWSGSDNNGAREIYVSLQNTAIIVPGVAGPASTIPSGPLTTFAATLPLNLGKRQLVYVSPRYSVSIEVVEDKK